MDVVFVDASVLFASAYRLDAGSHKLWQLRDVSIVTTETEAAYAMNNLTFDEQQQELQNLLEHTQVLNVDTRTGGHSDAIEEHPLVLAAQEVDANYLVTADITHLGEYFGDDIGRMTILPPSAYLNIHDLS